jgi:hypothetical protein
LADTGPEKAWDHDSTPAENTEDVGAFEGQLGGMSVEFSGDWHSDRTRIRYRVRHCVSP